MPVILNGTDLHLVGAVGFDLFDEFFTHSEVLMALAEVGSAADLTIHINSPGGFTDQGEGIANAIRARAGKTTIVVTGVAMSAATIIACACDEVVMCQGSMWMVHEPQVSLQFADAEGVASAARYQQLMTDAYAGAYSTRTGRPDAEVRAWMKATTYFDAREAIEVGFADRQSADVIDFAAVAPAYPYADAKIVARAPPALVARARENDWTLRASSRPKASAPIAPHPEKETTMTDKERADALAAEVADLKAQAKQNESADAAVELETLRAEKKARENTDAILALDEAEGRRAQAKALADAGVPAEKAKAILSASAKDVDDPRETRRLNGQGLTGGGNASSPTAKGDKTVLASAVARTNKRR